MMIKIKSISATLFLGLLAVAITDAETNPLSAASAEWPQFLGPDRTGVSAEKGLARKWPDNGLKELWSVKLGQGFGGAAIKDNRVFLLDRAGTSEEVVRCLDFKNGRELWSYSYTTKEVQLPFPGSRSTPTVDGDLVYTLGRVGNLTCVSRETHKAVWSHDLMKDFGYETTSRWGYSQSPLVHGDLIIAVALDGSSGRLVAYDKQTGKKAWQTEDIHGAHYVSPTLFKIAGEEQVLMFGANKKNKRGLWTSVNPRSGKVLWQWGGYFNNIMIPAPTQIDDNRLFITGGYGAGSVMIKLTKNGARYSVQELFRIDGEGSQIHPALLHNGHLYANWNTNENLKKGKMEKGGLACIDLKGNIVWRTGENPNFNRGNLMLVDGMIIILDGELGELALVAPNPSGYRELGRSKVFRDLKKRNNLIWAPMALSGGKLICRSQNQLKCLDVSGGQLGGD
ncbi:MAG: outer membrane protein assembly factor BamB [Limisphaerales bacterium]|jgi:outer membrane protein assembly factor BamB